MRWLEATLLARMSPCVLITGMALSAGCVESPGHPRPEAAMDRDLGPIVPQHQMPTLERLTARPAPTPPAPQPSRGRDTSAFEARVIALERRRCPEIIERTIQRTRDDIWGEDPEYEQAAPDPEERERDVDIELTTISETLAFAIVTTPCHESGVYNLHATLYVEMNGVVRLAKFAPPPRWSRPYASSLHLREPELARALWNPTIAQDARGIVLATTATTVLDRGLGDAGFGAEYVWQRSRFVLHSLNERGGGRYAPSRVGGFPRVAPAALRCNGAFEVSRAGADAILTTHAGLVRRITRFALADADCEARGDTIICGARDLAPWAEYALVSDDDDWVVLRIADDPTQREDEIVRVPRGCTL